MLFLSEDTKALTCKWIHTVISSNFERTKLYFNPKLTSTSGFLFNIAVVLIRILFDIHKVNKTKNNFFKMIEQIEPLFCITTKPIDFGKLDKVNPEIIKDFIANFEISLLNENEFNDTTILYFMIHIIISYFLKNLGDEYSNIMNRIGLMYKNKQDHDPK